MVPERAYWVSMQGAISVTKPGPHLPKYSSNNFLKEEKKIIGTFSEGISASGFSGHESSSVTEVLVISTPGHNPYWWRMSLCPPLVVDPG